MSFDDKIEIDTMERSCERIVPPESESTLADEKKQLPDVIREPKTTAAKGIARDRQSSSESRAQAQPSSLEPVSGQRASYSLRLAAAIIDSTIIGVLGYCALILVFEGYFLVTTGRFEPVRFDASMLPGFIIMFAYCASQVFLPLVATLLAFAMCMVCSTTSNFASMGVFINVAVIASYFALFESSYWRGTPGKRLLRLVVQKSDGSRLSFFDALKRYLLKVTLLLPIPAGLMVAAKSKEKQFLHDQIVHSEVWQGIGQVGRIDYLSQPKANFYNRVAQAMVQISLCVGLIVILNHLNTYDIREYLGSARVNAVAKQFGVKSDQAYAAMKEQIESLLEDDEIHAVHHLKEFANICQQKFGRSDPRYINAILRYVELEKRYGPGRKEADMTLRETLAFMAKNRLALPFGSDESGRNAGRKEIAMSVSEFASLVDGIASDDFFSAQAMWDEKKPELMKVASRLFKQSIDLQSFYSTGSYTLPNVEWRLGIVGEHADSVSQLYLKANNVDGARSILQQTLDLFFHQPKKVQEDRGVQELTQRMTRHLEEIEHGHER